MNVIIFKIKSKGGGQAFTILFKNKTKTFIITVGQSIKENDAS